MQQYYTVYCGNILDSLEVHFNACHLPIHIQLKKSFKKKKIFYVDSGFLIHGPQRQCYCAAMRHFLPKPHDRVYPPLYIQLFGLVSSIQYFSVVLYSRHCPVHLLYTLRSCHRVMCTLCSPLYCPVVLLCVSPLSWRNNILFHFLLIWRNEK